MCISSDPYIIPPVGIIIKMQATLAFKGQGTNRFEQTTKQQKTFPITFQESKSTNCTKYSHLGKRHSNSPGPQRFRSMFWSQFSRTSFPTIFEVKRSTGTSSLPGRLTSPFCFSVSTFKGILRKTWGFSQDA